VAIKDLRDNLKRLKDADPVELASQVNGWIQESGEAIRLRVEDEVEKAVTKRGFVKRSEFQKLEARIAALEGKPKRSVKKSAAKDSPKSSSKKSVKTKAKGKK
jgi:BMFP domain-containing protein YqiC